MTLEDKEKGWWEAPAGEKWLCPKCGEASPIEYWSERIAYCEDCGEHDARECPKCGEIFDHVWGAEDIKSGD